MTRTIIVKNHNISKNKTPTEELLYLIKKKSIKGLNNVLFQIFGAKSEKYKNLNLSIQKSPFWFGFDKLYVGL